MDRDITNDMKMVKIISGNNTAKVEEQVNLFLADPRITVVEVQLAREYMGRVNDPEHMTTVLVTYIKIKESEL